MPAPPRPAGPLQQPLVRSLLSWVSSRMPKENEAIDNNKLTRQLGIIWVANKISWLLYRQYNGFQLVTYQSTTSSASLLFTHKPSVARPPSYWAFWWWDSGWNCLTFGHNPKIHSHSAPTQLVIWFNILQQRFPNASPKCVPVPHYAIYTTTSLRGETSFQLQTS